MIGVDDRSQWLGGGPDAYKSQILFYDKLLLMHANAAINQWRYGAHQKTKYDHFANEMEYLLDTPYFITNLHLHDIPIEGETALALQESIADVEVKLDKVLSDRAGAEVSGDEVMRLIALQASLSTRLAAESLTTHGQPAVSAHVIPSSIKSSPSPKLTTGDVIQLAVNRVLVPNDENSWEDVFALKSDKDVQDRARKLRLWAAKAAKSESSLAIIDEQLADLISDYERYLRAHRLKYASTTIGVVITEGAEMLEDLLKLRLGKITGRLFSATKAKADITLSEMKAPGRELSIVTLINERLA